MAEELLDAVTEEAQSIAALRDGMSGHLAAFDAALVAPTLAADLPMIGTGLGALENLETQLTSPLNNLFKKIDDALLELQQKWDAGVIDTSLPESIKNALDGFEGLVPELKEDGTVDLKITVEKTVETDVDLAENLGIEEGALLDIDGSAAAELSLSAQMGITLDVSADKTVLNISDDPIATLCIKAEADLASEADLGVVELGFDAETQEGGLEMKFDLLSTAGGLDVSLRDGAEAGLSGAFTTKFAGGFLPTITAELDLDFGTLDGDFSFDNLFNLPDLSLTGMTIDGGSMIEFLQLNFGQIIDVLDTFPFGEVLDFLTTPIPIISELPFDLPEIDDIDGVTIGDLVYFSSGVEVDLSFVQWASDLLEFGSGLMDLERDPFGNFNLGDISFSGLDLGNFLGDSLDFAGFLDEAARLIPDDIWGNLGEWGAGLDGFNASPDVFAFPLLTNPLDTAMGLLFSGIGGNVDPVDLLTIDLPELTISDYANMGAPFGPFRIGLEGAFDITADFALGYDSAGIFGDGEFAEGFYIEANLDPVVDVAYPIMEAKFFIGATGSVDLGIAEAGLRGGLEGTIAIGFGEDTGGINRLVDLVPCLFDDIGGRLAAVVDAFARIGVGPFSYTVRENLFDVTLAQFNGDPCSGAGGHDGREVTGSGLATIDAANQTLLLNVGKRADSRGLDASIDVDYANNSEAQHEVFRISLSRDEDGVVIPNELVVSAFGVFERYSIQGLTTISGDFHNGNDVLVVDEDVTLPLNIDVGAGSGEDNDAVTGSNQNDTIQGVTGDDVLRGGGGIDRIFGQSGNDILDGGADGDLLHGGSGSDEVDYSQSTSGVTITPFDFSQIGTLSPAQLALLGGVNSGRAMIGSGGDAEGDVLLQIERLVGSRFDDVLTGDPSNANQLDGGDGDDQLTGSQVGDLLVGGRGADQLKGNDGDDWTTFAFADSGVGVLLNLGIGTGGEALGDTYLSIENFMLSGHDDFFIGDAGDNEVLGLEGDDFINGFGGADTINAGPGDDTVVGHGDGAILSGGGYSNRHDGNNTITYATATPVGFAFGGFSTRIDLSTGTADIGFFGTDSLAMGIRLEPDGTEVVAAGLNSFDNVIGTSDSDYIIGDDKNNLIDSGADDDKIEAGGGFDTLVGGAGADTLNGGSGVDWADYSAATAGVTINLDDGTGLGAEAQGDDLDNIENVLGSAFTDSLTGDENVNVLDPGGYSLFGSETVKGGLGVDVVRLIYDEQMDSATGFDLELKADGSGGTDNTNGDTVVEFNEIERLHVVFGSGDDTVVTKHNQADVIVTGEGDDFVLSAYGADMVRLGGGEDTVSRGDDFENGGAGSAGGEGFWLDGGAGFDHLSVDLSFASHAITIDLLSAFGALAFERGIGVDGAYIENFENVIDLATADGDDFVRVAGDFERKINLGDGDNLLDASEGDVTVTSGSGNDTITAALNGDLVAKTGEGDDIITIGVGTNSVDAADGDWDVLIADYSDEYKVDLQQAKDGPAGSGTLNVWGGLNVIFQVGATEFDGIEQFQITGGSNNDTLNGADFDDGPGDILDGQGGSDFIDGKKGDDSLIGGLGKDNLHGGEGNDTLSAGGVGIEGGEFGPGGIYANGDLMIGGAGADTYILGTEEMNFYGLGDNQTNDYARVELALEDTVELFGTADDYILVSNGEAPAELYLEATDNLVAIFNHVSEDAALVGLDDARLDFKGADDDILPDAFAPISMAIDLDAIGAGGLLPIDPVIEIPTTITQLQRIDAQTVAQDLNIGSIKNAVYSGSVASFGSFEGNLDFADGYKSGFVLSTGRVEDIVGENTDAGQIVSSGYAETVQLEFTELVDGVAVAELPSLRDGLRSLTLVDDNDRLGGGTAGFSGLDLDAIFLSYTKLSDSDINSAKDLNSDILLPKLDLFQFNPGFLRYTPGDMRGGGAFEQEFKGVTNGIVQMHEARLNTVDFGQGPGKGVLTLGDGGQLELELIEALDTSDQPVFLYTVEGGDTEALLADIRASDEGIQPSGDLSTDLGLLGSEGDRARLTADFTVVEASDGPIDLFEVVILTEELPEFGGADLTDTFSVKINGAEALVLSDGRAATMKNLATTPSGSFHSDLVLNLPETGPLSDDIRADAYTRVLTIRAPVLAGENSLDISVADGRDGLLDSAIIVMPLGEINVINGTDADDALVGTLGDDDVRAGFGDDLYVLGEGFDRYDGAAGLDTAWTDVALDDLKFEFQRDIVIVGHGEHETELRNVERLVIDQGASAPITFDLVEAARLGNLPPMPGDDSGKVDQGQSKLDAPINLLANDIDLAGGTLRIVEIASTTHFAPTTDGKSGEIPGLYGTFSLVGEGLGFYTLFDEYIGTDAALVEDFFYLVSDGEQSAEARVTFTVDPVPDVTPPQITLDPLESSDPSPALSGTIDDPLALIKVTIGAETVVATNLGNGNWTIPPGTFADLPIGPVEVHLEATDGAGNTTEITDKEAVEIIIPPDVTPPVVTLTPVETTIASPELSGTVDDPTAIVLVEIGEFQFPADNFGDGKWLLTPGYIPDLEPGTYSITVIAFDAAGNQGSVTDKDGLIIQEPVPLVIDLSLEDIQALDDAGELGDLMSYANNPVAFDPLDLSSIDLSASGEQVVDLRVAGTPIANLILGSANADALGKQHYTRLSDFLLIDNTALSDLIFGQAEADEIAGDDGADILVGSAGDDTLKGGASFDRLFGGADNDSLDGGAGNDTLIGGAGDDVYTVDSASDKVVEDANQGHDRVLASVDFALQDHSEHLEDLTLTGSGDIDGTGNSGRNAIVGNSGDNVLNGGTGRDTLTGGAGNDEFRDDLGVDVMIGGTGDDIYYVDNRADSIVETINEGQDHVISTVAYALRDHSQHLETLTLIGSRAASITGNGRANVLTGNDEANVLNGANGDDTLIGGGGNDTFKDNRGADAMHGELGDDTYYIDDIGDTVHENANEGHDHVRSEIDFSLLNHSQAIEDLTLTGSTARTGLGNGLNNVISGNSQGNLLNGMRGDDTLYGYGGNDTFQGSHGIDRLVGGAGDDTYRVNDSGDQVIEDANEGVDLVFASVDYNLLTHSRFSEHLTLTGSGDLNGRGNGQANILTGNAGANDLGGGAGDDTVLGGGGNDTVNGNRGNDILTGGAGADLFVFQAGFGNDEISDFDPTVAGERIDLKRIKSITDFADLMAHHVSTSGAHAVISDGSGNTIELIGVSAAALASDDFAF